MITRLPSDLFTWSRWRRCNLFASFSARTPSIIANAGLIRERALGWCPGESLACRPKVGARAVLLREGDETSWCHLTEVEFVGVFGGEP